MAVGVRRNSRPGTRSEVGTSFGETVVSSTRPLFENRLPGGASQIAHALNQVPRHQFVEQPFAGQAYTDSSLPIGFGQTISKPSTVAFILLCLGLHSKAKVLEVGAGCGYVSALLAQLGLEVFAIERIGHLAQRARLRLDALGYHRILLRTGDGMKGWNEYAPFQFIIVSAAIAEIPALLLEQLDVGGKLIAPVIHALENSDGSGKGQNLILWERIGAKSYQQTDLGQCSFVAASMGR